MQSLSPDCTTLKHHYDSCFNSWFEGYLQPALDASRLNQPVPILPNPPPPQAADAADSGHSVDQAKVSEADRAGPSSRSPIITSWASAFPSPARKPAFAAPSISPGQIDPTREHRVFATVVNGGVIDTRGKTRAQIKAEEYESACGEAWKSYQGCLKRAIGQNHSLSALLEQARTEHPLHGQGGLEGTAWDPNGLPKGGE